MLYNINNPVIRKAAEHMSKRRYSPGEKRAEKKRSVEEILRELKQGTPSGGYREKSLKLHGNVCAKCGREFEPKDLHLLTVHHKDGNPRNNKRSNLQVMSRSKNRAKK